MQVYINERLNIALLFLFLITCNNSNDIIWSFYYIFAFWFIQQNTKKQFNIDIFLIFKDFISRVLFMNPILNVQKSHLNSHLSVLGERHGVMGAARHPGHLLVLQVTADQNGGQSLVGGAVAQLAVAVVAPCKQLTIWTEEEQPGSFSFTSFNNLNCVFNLQLLPNLKGKNDHFIN